MNSFLSVLYFQTNSYSSEKLSGGLLVITPQKIWFQISETKLKLVGGLASENHAKLLSQVLKEVKQKVNSVNADLKHSNDAFIPKGHSFTKDYIKYLNSYSQGILQFGEVLPISGTCNESEFGQLFSRFIHTEKPSVKKEKKTINLHLLNPKLQERADVNYTLKPTNPQLKGFYAETTISLLSKNGELFAGQLIDFRDEKQKVMKAVEEFTLAGYALDRFAKSMKWKPSKIEILFSKDGGGKKVDEFLNQVTRNSPEFISFEEDSKLPELVDTILTKPHLPLSRFLEEQEAA